MKPAIVLLSGGIDSATCLALAKQQGYNCYTLAFDYGQRHKAELQAAEKISQQLGAKEHKLISLGIGELGGSALTDHDIDMPAYQADAGITSTYVPARNTIFLSIALGWAEVLGAHDIFYGMNQDDLNGFPDCQPDYIQAFEKLAKLATQAGTEGESFHIQTPLANMTKADIIKKADELGIDLSQTVTCYQADAQGRACGTCPSCVIRQQGFAYSGICDQTIYQK
tara:strand:- start:1844 stop:2518 length:675 start_codon:yes stop_codon:yes gene_type:complete